jgi:glucose/arabinose dehydrogenase
VKKTSKLIIGLILTAIVAKAQSLKPDKNNGNIQLAKGFGAIVVAEETGKGRHIVVDKNGIVYVKLRKLEKGNGIAVLKDSNGDGKADEITGFGNYGGTGITIYSDYLYASSDSAVFRYKFKDGKVDVKSEELIISDLPTKTGGHASKSITINENGELFVNIGAPSNACQEVDRVKDSKGQDPCPELINSAGIWQFSADKLNQVFADGARFSTGIRNSVALEYDNYTHQVYALQHGRDQFYQLFPEYYTADQSAELPAEEFLLLKKGADFGWPYCYYDQFQGKKILAPEFGGDSKKTGRCSGVETPIFTFPGHWAPNDLLFYHGNQFPAKYKNGAFIAFHGSWNRAPLKQGGYFVAFVPFKDGKPSGPFEVFAEGFAGGKDIKNPADALARPTGLAEGPDGSLYITDSVKGKVWRVIYTGK